MRGTLAVQASMVAKLKADTDVLALVPAANIFDRHQRPEIFPCVVMGEAQAVTEDDVIALVASRSNRRATLYVDVHVWDRSGGLAGTKAIAGAVEECLHGALPSYAGSIGRRDMLFDSARFLRDPDGETGHGVLTFRTMLIEALP